MVCTLIDNREEDHFSSNALTVESSFNILTKEACDTLIVGLVISQLDYANNLYNGLPECDLKKLPRVTGLAAEIVLKSEENSLACLKKTALATDITENKI